MPNQVTRSVLAFVPDALTASQVGTWETDSITDLTLSDAATATLFGIDPDRAAEGEPLATYTRAIHPEDRAACAIQARQAIDEVAGSEGLGLRRSVDALLLVLGRALASRTGVFKA
ncbi:hypothetical protein FF100_28300 [Methylobacterium terricola]|uniref:PAS fold-containing protein n=1 Tax=Methylobacterium terricola TaxID=2583531 RepID=A0A5C4LB82_9HYPH|nr:hypothetical protein [Methylobacterium terricola]TNC08748.1 hypothetical protein FF100_28300 [Methylobacterium terricola]